MNEKSSQKKKKINIEIDNMLLKNTFWEDICKATTTILKTKLEIIMNLIHSTLVHVKKEYLPGHFQKKNVNVIANDVTMYKLPIFDIARCTRQT